MASRYFATVLLATLIPSSLRELAILLSLSGLPGFSPPIILRILAGTDVDDWEIEPLQVVDDGGAFAVLGVGRHLSDPPVIWRLRLDPPPACSDGLDNDGDGFVDCADTDCLDTWQGQSVCLP